ncbi:hypothetical protein IQ07DRAFT_500924 [Pyrenochaeta sp. DS3sAY3a]|nr:hypothetical protein IQ07DRAFT_500924 [Pyrenochaeta sp. DS3sAY3a]
MWWNDSIAWHLNTPYDYTQVAVLLIKWADELDELKTNAEVLEVEHLFRDRFRFRTEILELNVKSKPQHQLNHFLATFIVRKDGPNNLLIVYYSGHSMYRDLEHFLELTASMNLYQAKGFHRKASVNWNKAEDILRSEDTDSDVLIIMDTSYAVNSVQGRSNTSPRRYEMMSAAGIDETTAAPGDSSFTRAFIDNLIHLLDEKDDKPISTFRLNQRICMDERRRTTPSQVIQILPHSGHIILKPLKPGHVQRYEMFRARAGGRLTLNFELRDKNLSQEQVEVLARGLAHTFRDNEAIGLRRINWQGMAQVEQSQLERIALVQYAVVKWRNAVRRRREAIHQQRQIDAVP